MEEFKPNEGTTVIDHLPRHDEAASTTEEEEASKRRKVLNNGVVHEETVHSSTIDELELGRTLGVISCSPTKSSAGDDGACSCLAAEESSSSTSCCSSNESSKIVKDGLSLVDLEAQKSNFESKTADSTSLNKNNNNDNKKKKFSKETTPSSEHCVDSIGITELASPTKNLFPSSEEIEEFFSEAEKLDQKRFAEKYNYDIVKDLPLEGRYQWVYFKP